MKTEFRVPALVPACTSGGLADHAIEAAAKNPHGVSLSIHRGGAWVGVSSQQFLDEVRAVAKGLIGAGVPAASFDTSIMSISFPAPSKATGRAENGPAAAADEAQVHHGPWAALPFSTRPSRCRTIRGAGEAPAILRQPDAGVRLAFRVRGLLSRAYPHAIPCNHRACFKFR